ncbi:CDGSH iron-sulfur domain-containing protein [Candidatus Chloroploca asiatica]|uniref:CDGSH iron-sulfur domain-containing protein n=1 Tax=Candidatus Chloroploca asiatica TaxID=1506545 RepID=UPI000BE97893|nr:CDGSH iron-sulfur domain-containing protein [Candidatus Chloroploca asiatica]
MSEQNPKIIVTPNGPYAVLQTSRSATTRTRRVTGNILVERSDGQAVEIRNRMTLCRCGQSKNKPFCDGTHRAMSIQE